jgi:ketosteroid isomerase-like protein
MDLQELSDRIAIRDVIDRYSDAVTRRDWPGVGATFHDDAVWSVGGAFNLEYRSRANIEAGLRAGVGAFEFLVQMTHSVVIELDGDHATARTVINEMGRNPASGLFMLGIYTDALSRRDGRWAFDRRRFEPLYMDTAGVGGTATPA